MSAPPVDPLDAAQQRARRLGYRVLSCSNYAALRGHPAGHVVIQNDAAERVAGPFDIASAISWLSVYATPRPCTAPTPTVEEYARRVFSKSDSVATPPSRVPTKAEYEAAMAAGDTAKAVAIMRARIEAGLL